MNKFVFALVLSFSIFAEAVWNGLPVGPNEWVHAVRLRFARTNCSAVAISDRWILTAAHCLEMAGTDQRGITLYFGDDAKHSWSLMSYEARVYPSYREGFAKNPSPEEIKNDLALIKVSTSLSSLFSRSDSSKEKKKAEFPNFIVEAPVDARHLIAEKKSFSFVGTGKAYSGKGSKVRDFQKLWLPLDMIYSDDHQILVGKSPTKNVGTCQGDSGGGLFVGTSDKPTLVGINSGFFPYDKPCGSPETQSVFVFLDEEKLHWIRQTTGLQ